MNLSFRMRRIGPRLLPWLAAALFGVQLLGAHMHLHGEDHDHAGAHAHSVHSVHAVCHAHADHLGEAEIGLWQALAGKLPDSHEPGSAALTWLLEIPAAARPQARFTLQHSRHRPHKRAHYRPLLRAPPR
jgi:hypothetical protein